MINTVTSFSSFFLKITFFFSMNVDVYPADSCIYFEEDEKKSLFWKLYISLVKTFMCYLVVIESRR